MLDNHPSRAALSSEMHARKLTRLPTPSRVFQYVLMVTADQAAANEEAVRQALGSRDDSLNTGSRYLACELDGMFFAFERHSEFMTYTFVVQDAGQTLFDLSALPAIERWVAGAVGMVIRSSHIVLVAGEPDAKAVAAAFSTDDLVISDAVGGAARIWSDFRLHPDGFGRLLIADRGMQGVEASQLVQRLQELGNYRKMALLGLPLARDAAPKLSGLENRLAEMTVHISSAASNDESLLADLSALSAELAELTAATSYRMSATAAYAGICADRLRHLSVSPVKGHVSFDDFTERRLAPAVRTCEAFAKRLADLSARAERTSALLRTRVETALARQNRDLLASMDERTALQLRLQHTVEGLSVTAVSYYATGLWHYLREALHPIGVAIPAWSDIVAIPVIILLTWLSIRALTHRAGEGRSDTAPVSARDMR